MIFPCRSRVFVLSAIVWTVSIISSLAATAPGGRKPPGPPIELVSTACTESSATLAWKPPADGGPVASYRIYEYGVAVGTSEGLSFTVTGLRPGTNYVFWVRAMDSAGNLSAPSLRLSVATPGTPPPPAASPELRVVAYYASWRAYQGYTPKALDGGKLTAINYAFADIGKDLKLMVSDPEVDPGNFDELARLKLTYPHLLTFISVGGWDGSKRFSDVALTEGSRAAFAASCIEFMVKHGFDGIDLDWEYPTTGGKAGNVRRAADKGNFTLLLAKLREEIEKQGQRDGRRYYLTIAGAATPSYVRTYTEMNLLHPYLDWINVMTYDLHGKWNRYTDFHAALHENADASGQEKLSAAGCLRNYLEAGVPVAKIVMGVPFYGRLYTGVEDVNNGLYRRFKNCTTIPAVEAASIYLSAPGWVRYWHAESMAPWLFNGSAFIDCDDTESLEKKANYVRDQDLGGVMIWEISLDPNQVLLDAFLRGLSPGPVPVNEAEKPEELEDLKEAETRITDSQHTADQPLFSTVKSSSSTSQF